MVVIDLHHMNRNEAIRFFIDRYNEAVKTGRKEITVVHGYGSSGKGGVIKKEIKTFFDLHSSYLSYKTDLNPGATLVFPIKIINELEDLISIDILDFCKSSPKTIEKIKGNFFKKYTNQEINSCVKKLIKKNYLTVTLKKNSEVYQTKGE